MSFRTNRIIGGVAPSEYLRKLETGDKQTPRIDSGNLDAYLRSHLIDPTFLRTDDFEGFMIDRQTKLQKLIEQATGKLVYSGTEADEGIDVDVEEDSNLELRR